MKFRQSIFLVTALFMIAALVACSSSSHTTPPPPAISVTLTGAPASLATNATAPLTATVANDSANAGVTWSCTPAGSCGTFSASSTASGTATTYTAPASVPSGSTVTVTATSVTDSTKSSSAVITITGSTGALAVTISSAPVSLQVGGGGAVTATVSNDSANAGVNWSCTPVAACGTFSASTTASGVATDFTAPATLPTGNSVTVTATSVTDPTKFASAVITISGPNTTLADGSYVFSVSGISGTTGAPYSVAGAFVVSGGLITGGEQDFNDLAAPAHDSINGATSSFSTSGDGNLIVVLDTQDTNVGINGVETLNGTLACSCTALITEYDLSATAGGTLDLQTSTAAPSGGYAFGVAGMDQIEDALAIGGIINVDGSGTISGTNSVFDINDGGSTAQAQTFAASTVSAPDSFGMVTFTLNPTDSTDFPQIALVGYIVDDTRIRLVEGNDLFAGATGGTALAQGVNTGTFTSIAGNSYVVGMTGYDDVFVLQAAGVLTANADLSVSGTISYNDLVTNTPTSSAVTGGTYTVDATGRVTMTGVTDGTETFNLQLYLSGDGHALAATMDSTDVLAGLGYGQNGSFSAGSFFGSYALAAGGADAVDEDPFFSIGPVSADGAGNVATSLSGFVDVNWLFDGVPTPDQPVSGTFTADPSGVFTGTITGLDLQNSTSPDTFTYYLIDNTRIIGIETDFNQLTLGYFDLQQ